MLSEPRAIKPSRRRRAVAPRAGARCQPSCRCRAAGSRSRAGPRRRHGFWSLSPASIAATASPNGEDVVDDLLGRWVVVLDDLDVEGVRGDLEHQRDRITGHVLDPIQAPGLAEDAIHLRDRDCPPVAIALRHCRVFRSHFVHHRFPNRGSRPRRILRVVRSPTSRCRGIGITWPSSNQISWSPPSRTNSHVRPCSRAAFAIRRRSSSRFTWHRSGGASPRQGYVARQAR